MQAGLDGKENSGHRRSVFSFNSFYGTNQESATYLWRIESDDYFRIADHPGACATLTNHVFGAAPGRISLASDHHTCSVRTNAEVPAWNGLLKQITKALLERALKVELTEHVRYEKHDPAGHNSENSRNGSTTKKLKGEFGEMDLETPRDRNGSFEPAIVSKA